MNFHRNHSIRSVNSLQRITRYPDIFQQGRRCAEMFGSRSSNTARRCSVSYSFIYSYSVMNFCLYVEPDKNLQRFIKIVFGSYNKPLEHRLQIYVFSKTSSLILSSHLHIDEPNRFFFYSSQPKYFCAFPMPARLVYIQPISSVIYPP